MTRSVLAALVVAARSRLPLRAQAGLRDAQDPILGSYIVVLKPDAARSAVAAPSARPLVPTVAQELSRAHGGARHVRLSVRPQGLRRQAVRRPGRALTNDPRVDYVEQDQVFHDARDPDSCDLGARSGRPARPASQQHLHLQPDRAGRSGLHHRHRDARDPSAVHRQDRQRIHGDQRRKRHERLQRPRHARRRAQSAARPTASRSRSRSTRCASSTARARARTRASSPAWTGSPRTTARRPSPT